LILGKISKIGATIKAKMHQIRLPLGLCPRSRWGSLQHSPDPLAVFKGPISKGREGKRREVKGRGGEEKERIGEGKGGEGCPHWESGSASAFYEYGTFYPNLYFPC